MAEKNRVRNLSTRWLLPFKIVVFAIYIGLCAAILYTFLSRVNGVFTFLIGLVQLGIYLYFFFRLMQMTSKVYRVEFDDEFLYVMQKKQDMVIPLENIESVEISTLGGVYKVNLYHAEQLGKHFYFKLSLFYPLNFVSRDALVDLLRTKIEMAKSRKQTFLKNALYS